MIKIKTHLKEFESVIKIIGNISHETDYFFTPEGIKIRAVDASGTYLGLFNLSKDLFDEYEVEEEKTLTLSNELFGKLIKKVGKKELNIDFLEDAIQLSNPKEKYTLKFFVGQKDERPDPNPECKSIWKMKSDEFTKIVNEMSFLGTICNFVAKESLTVAMKADMIEGETITSAKQIRSEDCHCYYDINYIVSIDEIKNIFKEIRVGFGLETPLVIKGDNDYLNFVFILAPRVE